MERQSLAMDLIKSNLAAERTRAKVNGIIIVVLMLSWLLSMYMIFSYFANSSSIVIGDTSQTAENNGTNNSINQRG